MGVDSEVGRLRAVLVHRPGDELRRLTPRNTAALLFDAIPWVGRAQEEHDTFVAVLRAHGVEVLELAELLRAVLGNPAAREQAVRPVLADRRHGDALRAALTGHLADLHPDDLARVLVAGLAHDELRGGRGLTWALMHPQDFVVDPLPNLLFTRDSSLWVGDTAAVTSLAMPARRRETSLLDVVYTHHPRFAGAPVLYRPDLEPLEGGDVLLLGHGVVAVGTGERTTPAGVERLASRVLARGLAHTVLAVPIGQQRATMHLDTVCTMVDEDAVVMYPAVAQTLQAYRLRWQPDAAPGDGGSETGGLVVDGPHPFLGAAAAAMGVDQLRVIDTGLDPVTAEREQWDDGNNTLAIGPRLAVAYERNVETNRRLEAAGIDVVAVAGSELGSGRGGPRCMSCPLRRDPLRTH